TTASQPGTRAGPHDDLGRAGSGTRARRVGYWCRESRRRAPHAAGGRDRGADRHCIFHLQFHNIWLERALHVILPGVVLFAALALARKPGSRLAVALAGLLLSSSLHSSVYALGHPRREQWREAAKTIRANWKAGDTIAVTAPTTWRALPHYGLSEL